MYSLVENLIVYRINDEDSILYNLSRIFNDLDNACFDNSVIISRIYNEINKLLVLSTKYAFNGNLWHCYIAYILASHENSFSLISEMSDVSEGSVNSFVLHDFDIFMKLFDYDFSIVEDKLNIDCFSILCDYNAVNKSKNLYNNEVSSKIISLSCDLENVSSVSDMYRVVSSFYKRYGVGSFGLNSTFKLSYDENVLIPITSLDDVVLDDLVGYDTQKAKLVENTEAFVNGFDANNVLLYGDAGTGKSTSIKAILNEFSAKGLRMIEVYKHDAKYLSDIISLIKNRNYRFILYMDDLSFEESESEYKYLKALIEGGIESKADNVLIYATSNRRHLIKETWNERVNTSSDEEMYKSDTVREKLSLVDRFGVTIGYYKPSMKEYFEIVKTLAKKYSEIDLCDDELVSIANKWIMTHGGPSGRTAEQLIVYLKAKCSMKK